MQNLISIDIANTNSYLYLTCAEMVEWFINNKKELNAVDLVYTFGLVERFNPQTILISFLRESKETGKRIRKAALGSAAAMVLHMI